ncbi:hypothetical protein ABT010_33635 [Streptomyces sp. NPDC002668]|uniref:hypothetical protein n=1 Tax=Streptomyces sp. NPDC002668 TaxID=3154422 RepID=UPI003316A32F
MRDNGRPAIKASTIHPHLLNLRESEKRMAVCPDCRTWRRLQRSMITPHRLDATAPRSPRCPGSAQRFEIDLTAGQWLARLQEASEDASSRRSTTVARKPKPTATPAVSQIKPVPLSADTARKAYRTHLKQCPTCTGRTRCTDGKRLAAMYARLERQQPRRDRVRAVLARERVRFDRRYAAEAAQKMAAELTKRQEATTDAKKLTKRSGTIVEEANNRCRRSAKGAVSEFCGPDVPLEPLRITA